MNINGAVLYDPANKIEGELTDIFISKGSVSASPGDGETIEADGLIAMPGGIDIHTHLSSTRDRSAGFSTKEIADLYLSLGYTHIIEAGIAYSDLDEYIELTKRLPIGCSILELIGSKAGGEISEKYLAKKYVGQRGVEMFLDNKTDEEGSPTSHIHLPRLALPGSFNVLKDFIKKLAGRRCHIAHIAYYIFGENGKGEHLPMVKEAAELLANNKNVTFDLGPPTFGRSLAYTADTELAERVARSSGNIADTASQWSAVEYEFIQERYIDSLFWLTAIGLILEIEDLSRASLSIDFPSGGSIEGYPFTIASLMSLEVRNRFIKNLNHQAVALSSLLANERELGLNEIAQLTRSSPASACRFTDRGHLGVEAYADVVLYRRDKDLEKMFRYPAYVIRSGEVVVRNGKVV